MPFASVSFMFIFLYRLLFIEMLVRFSGLAKAAGSLVAIAGLSCLVSTQICRERHFVWLPRFIL